MAFLEGINHEIGDIDANDFQFGYIISPVGTIKEAVEISLTLPISSFELGYVISPIETTKEAVIVLSNYSMRIRS